MLSFYGLARDGERIVRGASFHGRRPTWLKPMNHNHLRLTRMIHSLGLLSRGDDARALLECLLSIYADHRDRIASETVSYWKQALNVRPL